MKRHLQSLPQRDEGSRGLTDVELLIARVHLGQWLRNRREELRVRPKEIAERVHWTTQFYGEIEKGLKSSDDIGAWIQLADMLQLDRAKLLEKVWSTRSGLTIALPADGDPRRRSLLELVVDLYRESEGDPLSGES